MGHEFEASFNDETIAMRPVIKEGMYHQFQQYMQILCSIYFASRGFQSWFKSDNITAVIIYWNCNNTFWTWNAWRLRIIKRQSSYKEWDHCLYWTGETRLHDWDVAPCDSTAKIPRLWIWEWATQSPSSSEMYDAPFERLVLIKWCSSIVGASSALQPIRVLGPHNCVIWSIVCCNTPHCTAANQK